MPLSESALRTASNRPAVKADVRSFGSGVMPLQVSTSKGPAGVPTEATPVAASAPQAVQSIGPAGSATPKPVLSHRYLSGVCQIHSTLTAPEHSRPWVKERNGHSKGSGFVIPGRLIVTNAHCINYASVVKVQRHMSDEKINARVLRINSDCDVAVLTVDDPDFWLMSDPDSDDPTAKIELPAFDFGELPELQDTVRVVG
jgi:S1-C subfamily serine protease